MTLWQGLKTLSEVAKMLNGVDVNEEIKQTNKIGVYVCSCDGSFENSIDLEPIIDYVKHLPEVVKAEHHKHLCKKDELKLIKEDIRNEVIDRVVVAGCTPSIYEDIFSCAFEDVGLNRFLYEHANIREHCAWVHNDKHAATEKVKSLISMAIAKLRLSEPIVGTEIEIIPNAMVIGGGVAGMRASLDLAQNGFKCYLVECEPELGGRTYKLNTTYPTSNCGICCLHDCKNCKLTPKIEEFYNNPNIEVLTNSEVINIDGCIGNYHVEVKNKIGDLKHLLVGTIIISTGSKTFDANKIPEYGYENEDVVTILELEKLDCYRRPSDGKVPETVNFILCVGSRSEKGGNPHCSLVCCNFAIGQAREIKELYPDTNVYVHYIDIRAAYQGFEEFYAEARNMGINFVRGRVAQVEKTGNKLLVRTKDMDIGKLLKIKSDLVVLAVGQEPADGTEQLAKMTNKELDIEGFLKNINPQYRCLEETGVFAAGCALGPKGIRHSIADAKNAAMNTANLLGKGNIRLSPIKSCVIDANCDGCAYCIDPCPYNALTLIDYKRNGGIKKTIEVDVGKCRGCGVCAATCPKKGIYVANYKPDQIYAMIDAALEDGKIANDDFEPIILAFCCRWCGYLAADSAGIRNIEYSPGLRIIRIMCSGMIHPNNVIDALTKGADGVMIFGCYREEDLRDLGPTKFKACHYIDGIKKTENRAEAIKLILEDYGLEPDRFKLVRIFASEGQKFSQNVKEMSETLRTLGPSPFKIM